MTQPWSKNFDAVRPAPFPVRSHPLAWMAGYLLLAYLFSLHELVPVVPGTTFSLMSLPVALLMFAMLVRPLREAPVYIAIHLASWLVFHAGVQFRAFDAARLLLEVAEAAAVVFVTWRFFAPRFNEPWSVAIYHVVILALVALGGLALILIARAAHSLGVEAPPVLLERPALAWRYWWLGHACSYLALGGPAAVLVALRHRLVILASDRKGRRTYALMSAALLVTCLVAFPITDLSWLGLPPDVRQALWLLPLPFALALPVRFRAKGGSTAILIMSLVVILSVTGPNADANWTGLPPSATPTQALLLMTATACMVVAAILRQLLLAQAEALRAKEAKARFVSMLNHELRTPLNAILGFSELMRVQKVRDIDEAMGGIENIHASGQRLLAMIEGLLSQADQGASVFELRKRPVPLRQFVARVVEGLQPGSVVFRYPVQVDIPEELQIEADQRALEQILLVLLSYPLRFVTPKTSITVSANQSGTDTVLDVQSDGLSGAATDERDKLELQLAKALALAHGARLTVLHSDRGSRHAQLTFFATRAAI